MRDRTLFGKFYKCPEEGEVQILDLNNKFTNKIINWGVFTFNKTVIEAGKNGRWKKKEKWRKTQSERGHKYKLPADFCGGERVSNIGKTTFHLDSHTISKGKSNCSDLGSS